MQPLHNFLFEINLCYQGDYNVTVQAFVRVPLPIPIVRVPLPSAVFLGAAAYVLSAGQARAGTGTR